MPCFVIGSTLCSALRRPCLRLTIQAQRIFVTQSLFQLGAFYNFIAFVAAFALVPRSVLAQASTCGLSHVGRYWADVDPDHSGLTVAT